MLIKRSSFKILAAVILVVALAIITVYSLGKKIPEKITMRWLKEASAAQEITLRSYDVIVVGSDPEGIAAAVSAARNGLDTLLVDHRERVGGLYTLGWLNTLDLNYKESKGKEVLNNGIFLEFYQAVGGQKAFDLRDAQKAFENMLTEAGVKFLLGVQPDIYPIIEDGTAKGIKVKKYGVVLKITANTVIDATQDADLAASAGVPYKFGREELGLPDEVGASTLLFAVKNVDWVKVKGDLNGDKNSYTGATDKVAYGYEIMFKAPTKDPHIQIRGLNAGRQGNGTVLINALQIFRLNPLDQEAKKDAITRAKAELPGIINFMRKNLPGWEKAKLAGTAPELYIRESRHIKGVKTLTAEDIFEGRFPEDTVALGSYPIDIQAREKGMTGSALNGTSPYGVPFGVMVPENIEGLLVASRSASYDTVAHGSARTVPVGMALGQAAGVAAKVAGESGLSFQEMARDKEAIAEVRQRLEQQGVDLAAVPVANPAAQSWAYPYIKHLRSRAMLSMGYYNDYRLQEQATWNTFRRMFVLLNYNSPLQVDLQAFKDYSNTQKISGLLFLKIAGQILDKELSTYRQLSNLGIIDETTLANLSKEEEILLNEQAYALVDGLVDYLVGLKHQTVTSM